MKTPCRSRQTAEMKNRVLLKSALLLLLIAADGLVTASEVSFWNIPTLEPESSGPRSIEVSNFAELHLGTSDAPKMHSGARYSEMHLEARCSETCLDSIRLNEPPFGKLHVHTCNTTER